MEEGKVKWSWGAMAAAAMVQVLGASGGSAVVQRGGGGELEVEEARCGWP